VVPRAGKPVGQSVVVREVGCQERLSASRFPIPASLDLPAAGPLTAIVPLLNNRGLLRGDSSRRARGRMMSGFQPGPGPGAACRTGASPPYVSGTRALERRSQNEEVDGLRARR